MHKFYNVQVHSVYLEFVGQVILNIKNKMYWIFVKHCFSAIDFQHFNSFFSLLLLQRSC